MSTQKQISIDEQLTRVPPQVRRIVESARHTVTSTAPSAVEIPYQSTRPANPVTMWKLARYAVNGENVVGLGTFTKHSTLFFYRGRELDDPNDLLQGSGKDTRFVTLREAADAELPAVKQLVRQAFKLAAK